MAATQCSTTMALVLVICSLFVGTGLASKYDLSHFNRSSFPPGFVFGAASSAYQARADPYCGWTGLQPVQYEGAASEGGRGPSIWDTFTHQFPDKILDKSNGDVASDFYHRYKDDVKLMKDIGLDAFRLSISWSRILPTGRLNGGVNKEGIAFYNNVFNELLANGITPFVTIFHWDLPQGLEDEYSGFLSPLIVDDFRDFADICFKEFGDRVKHWITVNEPFTFINGGYDGGFLGTLAPGRCSSWAHCRTGDSATEPYVAGHHLLLSHAATVKLYREKYQASQKGEIGITIVTHWFTPATTSKLDIKAAQRALDFVFGWFTHPVVYGNYPRTMQAVVGERLPKFTVEQTKMLKGSFDFIGLNYYTGNYAAHTSARKGNLSCTGDQGVILTTRIKGVPIGDPTGVSIFYVYPKGLRDLIVYTKAKYNNPAIYITETGMGDDDKGTVQHAINDYQRIDFYNRHLHAIREAIKQGVNVKGIFPWSLMDNFEWGSGYTLRFGLCFVDYKNGLKRIPKRSALWFKDCLAKK